MVTWMSWQDYLKSSKRFAAIALRTDEDPTVRVQSAFKAVEFAIAACARKYKKIRPERGREVLFMELNFGARARDDFRTLLVAYYDSYGIVSKQRADYVCKKMRSLLETIYSSLGEELND